MRGKPWHGFFLKSHCCFIPRLQRRQDWQHCLCCWVCHFISWVCIDEKFCYTVQEDGWLLFSKHWRKKSSEIFRVQTVDLKTVQEVPSAMTTGRLWGQHGKDWNMISVFWLLDSISKPLSWCCKVILSACRSLQNWTLRRIWELLADGLSDRGFGSRSAVRETDIGSRVRYIFLSVWKLKNCTR